MTNPAQPVKLADPSAKGSKKPLIVTKPLQLSINQPSKKAAAPPPKGAAKAPAAASTEENQVNQTKSSATSTQQQLTAKSSSSVPQSPAIGTPIPLAGGAKPIIPISKLPVTIPLPLSKKASSDQPVSVFPAATEPSPDDLCDPGATMMAPPPTINEEAEKVEESVPPSDFYMSDPGHTCMEPPPTQGYDPNGLSDPGNTTYEPPPNNPEPLTPPNSPDSSATKEVTNCV